MQEQGDTRKGESVRVSILVGVLHQFLARGSSRNEPEKFESNAQDGDDVQKH